jgi:hypothetical protein
MKVGRLGPRNLGYTLKTPQVLPRVFEDYVVISVLQHLPFNHPICNKVLNPQMEVREWSNCVLIPFCCDSHYSHSFTLLPFEQSDMEYVFQICCYFTVRHTKLCANPVNSLEFLPFSSSIFSKICKSEFEFWF